MFVVTQCWFEKRLVRVPHPVFAHDCDYFLGLGDAGGSTLSWILVPSAFGFMVTSMMG